MKKLTLEGLGLVELSENEVVDTNGGGVFDTFNVWMSSVGQTIIDYTTIYANWASFDPTKDFKYES